MPEVYNHQKPDERVISWAKQRRSEISKELERLKLEDRTMAHILSLFEKLVCDYCHGEGAGLFGGDNIDGPRMATCPKCKGSGKPQQVPTPGAT